MAERSNWLLASGYWLLFWLLPICDLLKKMHGCKLLIVLPLLLTVASCTRDPKVQAQRYLENGNKFFAKDKYKEASIMYRRALQKNMRYGEAYYRLGLTDLKLASYGDASRMLRRAVDLDPNNADAAVKLADLFLVASSQDSTHSAELLKEVKDLCNKLLQMDPNSFDAHRILGQEALVSKDPAGAIQELAKANAAKPLQHDLVLSYFQALVANNQFADAEKLAREVMDKDKTFSPMYDLLYIQYMRQKQPDLGEQVLKSKIANNPKHANYLLQLAQHYYLLNKRPEMDAIIQQMTDEKTYPDGHLLAGDFFFFRAREFDRAEQQYDAGMKAFPKEELTYQKRLVELYASQTSKSREANDLIATILKEHPKDSDTIAMRAALMLTTGDREQINMAANDLQSLVTKTPNNHLLRYNLARADIAKGDLEAARLQLEEAVKLRPDFVAARVKLAQIYLAKGDAGKALKASDDTIALDRNNLQAHLTRSTALLAMGDKDKARTELDYIAKTYPQNPQAQFQVGRLAYDDKDYKKAGQIFGALYKANPSDGRGLVGVTETMVAEGHMPDALKQTQAAVDREPQRRDLKVFLANLEVRAEQYDNAIKIFQTLLQKEPNSADLLFRLAETERRKGDLNTAIDTFRRCSQAAPSDTNCLMQLGLLLEGTGKRDQAKPVWQQILKINPDHPVALNNLAYAEAEEGVDLDQALTMAQRAVQKVPNSLAMADTLGWIYIKKNLSDDAVRVFKDLVQKDPKNAVFHYHYGMALLQKGDKPSAKREFETALQDNPSKDDAGKIRDLLQKI